MKMTDNTQPVHDKKQILSNPERLFADLYPDASADKKQQLQVLSQQRHTLKQQQKDLQLRSKKLSRQIG